MYQKDLKAAPLKAACDDAVESCVHWAGVDLNTASSTLLQHVAGLGPKTAAAIVAARVGPDGPFTRRKELLSRKLMKTKLYEQAAGFLRVLGGKVAFDATEVHPDDYATATGLLSAAGLPTKSLEFGAEAAAARKSALDGLAADVCPGVPLETVTQVKQALSRPCLDPRETAKPPVFRKGVLELSDVRAGMELVGTVRNVTDFGCFVDCGVGKCTSNPHHTSISSSVFERLLVGAGEDGLLHTSAVPPSHPAPGMGQVLQVTVESVDVSRGRLALRLSGVEGGSAAAAGSDRPAKRPRDEGHTPAPSYSRGGDGRGHGGRRGRGTAPGASRGRDAARAPALSSRGGAGRGVPRGRASARGDGGRGRAGRGDRGGSRGGGAKRARGGGSFGAALARGGGFGGGSN